LCSEAGIGSVAGERRNLKESILAAEYLKSVPAPVIGKLLYEDENPTLRELKQKHKKLYPVMGNVNGSS
jgi:hypothetical protein